MYVYACTYIRIYKYVHIYVNKVCSDEASSLIHSETRRCEYIFVWSSTYIFSLYQCSHGWAVGLLHWKHFYAQCTNECLKLSEPYIHKELFYYFNICYILAFFSVATEKIDELNLISIFLFCFCYAMKLIIILYLRFIIHLFVIASIKYQIYIAPVILHLFRKQSGARAWTFVYVLGIRLNRKLIYCGITLLH